MELLTWTWKDLEDFNQKYASIPEQRGKYVTFLLYWHGLGILLADNHIPAEILYKMDQNGQAAIMYWTKFKDQIMQDRIAMNSPDHWKYFESYVEEMIRLREKNGLPTEWSIEHNRFID
jgi:hypothetical protein